MMFLFYTAGGRGVKVNGQTRNGTGNPGGPSEDIGIIGHDGADAGGYGAVNGVLPPVMFSLIHHATRNP